MRSACASINYCKETDPTMTRTTISGLRRIDIASPCTASWAAMAGDERVRHCGDCNKQVFNLSAMPEADAAALLSDNSEGALCVRFYQRADGTVMTADCSTSARAYTRRTLRKLPFVAGGALLAWSAAAHAAGPGAERPVGAQAATHQRPEPAPVLMMGAPMAITVVREPAVQVPVAKPGGAEQPQVRKQAERPSK
jgi:hypothetical protein